MRVRIDVASYDHPDARRLVEEVQQEYVARYGEADVTSVRAEEFAAPRGLFLLGYLNGEAVACGGWRRRERAAPGFEDGDVELKRMYVVPAGRGKGFSRLMLAELEDAAFRAGCTRVLLETGTRQPEAIALYRSSGYQEVAKFGPYREDPESVCFGKSL